MHGFDSILWTPRLLDEPKDHQFVLAAVRTTKHHYKPSIDAMAQSALQFTLELRRRAAAPLTTANVPKQVPRWRRQDTCLCR